MSNKLKKKRPATNHDSGQDSIFRQAWENMNHDMSRFVPGFLAKRAPKGKSKAWVVVVVTLVELLVLGVVSIFVYDWFVK